MKIARAYPRLTVDTSTSAAVAQAGGVVLAETIAATGLDRALSDALGPWRKPLATHDPAKVVLDLAMMLALGGDALAEIALLRGRARSWTQPRACASTPRPADRRAHRPPTTCCTSRASETPPISSDTSWPVTPS